MDVQLLLFRLTEAVLFSGIGVLFFALAFFLAVRFCPFSFRKEIEEDQNIALAILMGSVILGIALIVSAAMHG